MRLLLVFASVLFVSTVGLGLLVAVSLDAAIDVLFAAAILATIPLLLAWQAFTAWSFVLAEKSFRRMAWLSALLCVALPFAVPFAAFEALPYVQYPMAYAREAVHVRPLDRITGLR